jgi:hypothetical protein
LQAKRNNGIVSKKKINMKRLLLFIATFLTLTTAAVFGVSGPAAYAAPAADPDLPPPSTSSCISDWNNEKYVKGADSQKEKNYIKSRCDESKGGNCSTTTDKQDGKTYLVIKCKAATPSGGVDGSASSDPVTDDALDSSASCTQDNCELISNYLNPIITLLTALVGIAVVVGIIVGAIQVMTSAGDPQKNASGKNHIRNALIAFVSYIVLWAFLQWVIPGGLI